MEIFPSKLIEGVVVVFAFSLRENKNDNDDDDMKSENSFYFISQFFFPLFLTNIFFHIVKRENSDSVDILDINHHSAAHVIIHYVLRNHL